jgi:hypothetical protein
MPADSQVPEPGQPDPHPAWGPPPSGWDGQPAAAPGAGPDPAHRFGPPAKPGVLELRPLGFGDLLDATFAVIRLAPIPTLLNAVLVQLLPALLALWLLLPWFTGFEVSFDPGLSSPAEVVQGLERTWPSLAAGLGSYLAVQLLAGVLVIGPSTVAAMRATLGLRTGWGASLALSSRAMLRLVAWNLLAGAALLLVLALSVAGAAALARPLGPAVAGILLALWLLALLPLYVWLAIKLCFGPVELVARSMGIGSAIASSWRLVRGSWWRILGILLVVAIVLGLLSGLVVQILDVATGQFVSGSNTALGVGVGVAAQAVVGALSMVLGQVMVTLLHVDARIRHERLDLVLEAESRTAPAHPIPGHGARPVRPPR